MSLFLPGSNTDAWCPDLQISNFLTARILSSFYHFLVFILSNVFLHIHFHYFLSEKKPCYKWHGLGNWSKCENWQWEWLRRHGSRLLSRFLTTKISRLMRWWLLLLQEVYRLQWSLVLELVGDSQWKEPRALFKNWAGHSTVSLFKSLSLLRLGFLNLPILLCLGSFSYKSLVKVNFSDPP